MEGKDDGPTLGKGGGESDLCTKYNMIKIENSRIKIKRYRSVSDALKDSRGKPHLILVDQSAIAGYGATNIEFFKNIDMLIENHISAVFGIHSAVAKWAEDLVADIQENHKDVIVEIVPYQNYSDSTHYGAFAFIDFIKKYIDKGITT